MAHVEATASALIDAPPEVVYGILADYNHGHPSILPTKNFPSITVERGGIGAGTVINFRMRMLGSTRDGRMEITEPEPGRVLAESDPEHGVVTTFIVEPSDGGRRSSVTILTQWSTPGIKGMIENLLAPPALRKIYAEELGNLARVAAGKTTATAVAL